MLSNYILILSYNHFISILIFIISNIIIFLSLCIISARNLIYAILFLILLLLNGALIAFLYNAIFLSLLFIIIYVGAILVLFLFAIMILGQKKPYILKKKSKLKIFLILISFFIYLFIEFNGLNGSLIYKNMLYIKFYNNYILDNNITNFLDNINIIGYIIFQKKFLIIIYSTLILLIAMIISIFISKTNNKLIKNQERESQIKRNINNNIFLIN